MSENSTEGTALLRLIQKSESILLELIRSQSDRKLERAEKTHLGRLLIECEKADLLPTELLSGLRELSEVRNRMLHSVTNPDNSMDLEDGPWEKLVSDLKSFVVNV